MDILWVGDCLLGISLNVCLALITVIHIAIVVVVVMHFRQRVYVRTRLFARWSRATSGLMHRRFEGTFEHIVILPRKRWIVGKIWWLQLLLLQCIILMHATVEITCGK